MLAFILAACGSGDESSDESSPETTPGDSTDTTAGEDASASGGDDVIELTYWSGSTGSESMAEDWNATHPNIQINWSNPGIGALELPSRMLNAVQGGDAPDIVDVPTLTLPQLILGDVPADITAYVSDVEDQFAPEVWEMNSFDGTVYALGQDVGPMMFLYREDRFEELGLEVPTTWEEFAQLAEEVREKEPDSYLSTFDPGLFHFLTGAAMQAGSEWWSWDGEQWSVGIADAPSLEVAEYWQDLIDRDLVAVGPTSQPEWSVAINEGSIISFPSAVWAAGTLMNIAPDTAGDWAAAPIPRWSEDDPAVGQMGGSSSIVTSTSDHIEAATEFITWLNATEEGAESVANSESTRFMASRPGQELMSDLDPPALVGGQEDYYDIAIEAAGNLVIVDWGPNTITAITMYIDVINEAVANGESLTEALRTLDSQVRADLIETGFDVADG